MATGYPANVEIRAVFGQRVYYAWQIISWSFIAQPFSSCHARLYAANTFCRPARKMYNCACALSRRLQAILWGPICTCACESAIIGVRRRFSSHEQVAQICFNGQLTALMRIFDYVFIRSSIPKRTVCSEWRWQVKVACTVRPYVGSDGQQLRDFLASVAWL